MMENSKHTGGEMGKLFSQLFLYADRVTSEWSFLLSQ